MATSTSDTLPAPSGTMYFGWEGPGAEPPEWAPEAGEFANISFAKGAHPDELAAVLEEISTAYQDWNPSAPAVGPWGGIAPSALYPWNTITSYCGWAFSTDERKLIGFGAGHAAVNVPVPWAYDLETRAFEWLAEPPPTDGFTLLNGTEAHAANIAVEYPSDQFDTANGDWDGDYSGWTPGYGQPGKIFAEPGHSYHTLQFIPGASYGNTNGALLSVQRPTGSTIESDIFGSHLFDMDSREWVRTTNKHAQQGNASGGVAHDPVTNQVFYMGHVSSGDRAAMSVLDVATKTWRTRTPTASIGMPIHGGGFRMHHASGLLLSFCPETGGGAASPTGIRWRINAVSAAAAAGVGSFTWSTLTVTAASWPLSNAGNLEFAGMTDCCDEDDCFYAVNGIHGSTKVWKLTPPAGAVTLNDYLTGTWSMTEVNQTAGSLHSKHANGSSNGLYVFNRYHWDALSRSFVGQGDYVESPVQAIRPTTITD